MSKGFSPEEYMKKLGWQEGKGLGKELQGMQDPIRAVVKDDNAGLGKGYDIQDFAFWDNIYAKASANIQIQTTDNGVVMKSAEKTEVKIPVQYQGTFIKSVTPVRSNDPFNENDLITRCLTQQHKKSKGKDKRLQNFEADGHSLRDVPITTPPLSELIELEKKRVEKELSKNKKRKREEIEEKQDDKLEIVEPEKKRKNKDEEKKDKSSDKKKDKSSDKKKDKSSDKKKDKETDKSSDKKKDKETDKKKDKNAETKSSDKKKDKSSDKKKDKSSDKKKDKESDKKKDKKCEEPSRKKHKSS